MAQASIYQPDKNAMQSGKASMKHWVLEFVPDKPYIVDNLMGWNGMSDMKQEIYLHFPTKEAAIAYAKRQRIPYVAYAPNKRHLVKKAYADNFKSSKITS